MQAAMLKEMKQKSAVWPAMRALKATKVATDDKSAFSWWQQDRAPPKAFLCVLTACHLSVFCSACRKERRSLLRCTIPGPSAQAGAAGGTMWSVPPVQMPQLLRLLRQGRETATETQAMSGLLVPRVWHHP